MTDILFAPVQLAGIPFKNRIIRSATHEGMTDADGAPAAALKELYLKLARGGVGGIITGYAGIQQNGRSPYRNMLMIDRDTLVAPFRKLVAAVHETGTPIVLQIAHCGSQTRSKSTGLPVVAPSPLRNKFYSEDLPLELSEAEIEEIIDNFVKGIGRAKMAGFDGVQLHAAHGYLLAQFLSPHTNRRKDKWGGNTENRFRIIEEIYRRTRATVGKDYPVLIKMNAFDGRKKGMRVEEAVRIARLLEQAGCAAIEVSCGVAEDGFSTSRTERTPMEPLFASCFKFKGLPALVKKIARPLGNILSPPVRPFAAYNLEAAQKIKGAVSVPVITVGGLSSLADIRQALEAEKADLVSLSRAFIMEPDLVNKFRNGTAARSKCIACNYCLVMTEERPLKCYYGKLG